MEVFNFDSEETQQLINTKINKFKLASVLILIASIVLFLCSIILGAILYKNNSEEFNRTSIKIGKNIEDNEKMFLETVNKTFNENIIEINERIRAVEANFTKDNVTIENIRREFSQTINTIKQNMENKEQTILETVNKTLNIYNNEIMRTIQHDINNGIVEELSNSIDKIGKTVENHIQSNLENVSKTLSINKNEIIKRIEAINSDITKHNLTIEVIYQELNKTKNTIIERQLDLYNFNQKIENISKKIENLEEELKLQLDVYKTEQNWKIENLEDELELQLNKLNVYTLEQNSYCLDTMHRTENEGLVLYNCHGSGGNQEWQFKMNGELKNRESCVTFNVTTSSIIIDPCNDSVNQKWKFYAGVLRNPANDVCLESKERKVMAARCNPADERQMFKLKLLYTVDKFCTFKQGSYMGGKDWIIATNGYFVKSAECLTYSNSNLSRKACQNLNSQKWIYTNDGQIMNLHENYCVSKDNETVAVNTCDLNLESQRWMCT